MISSIFEKPLSLRTIGNYLGFWRFRFETAYNLTYESTIAVSDHYPVYARFWTNKDTDWLNITLIPFGIPIFNGSPIIELCLQKDSVQPSTIHGCASRTVITVQSAIGLSRLAYGLKRRRQNSCPHRTRSKGFLSTGFMWDLILYHSLSTQAFLHLPSHNLVQPFLCVPGKHTLQLQSSKKEEEQEKRPEYSPIGH